VTPLENLQLYISHPLLFLLLFFKILSKKYLPKKAMKSITSSTINNLVSLLNNGLPLRQIATRLNLSIGTVHKYKDLHLSQTFTNKAGRHKIVTDTTCRLIKRKILIGELKTANAVHNYLTQIGYVLSYSTCNRILKGMGFKAKIKV